MKKRIWELDALRGLALLGMIAIHLIYDLVDLYGILPWQQPMWYLLFKNNYGAIFLLISGISVTLGSRCVRRGIQVFACGFLCTLGTVFMVLIGEAGTDLIIYYGVLHCLGTCMLLWAIFRRLPSPVLAVLGIAFAAAGLWLRYQWFEVPAILIPLGFTPTWFVSSDYFPLLPNFGYFLLGAVLGRMLYAEKKSRLPEWNNPIIRFLRWCGEHSLLIYLVHQPLLAGITALFA